MNCIRVPLLIPVGSVLVMKKTAVIIAVCPQGRCSGCVNNIDSTCRKLHYDNDEDSDYRAVVIEPEREFIHVCGQDEVEALALPPWNSFGWESVYIPDCVIRFTNVENVVDAYPVGPYVSIFTKSSHGSVSHFAVPRLRSPLELKLLEELRGQAIEMSRCQISVRTLLTDRLKQVAYSVGDYISEFLPEVNEVTRERISEIASHHTSVLENFFPVVLDSEVEEVYVDRPESVVYFDHHRLGRCFAGFSVKHSDVSRLVTLLRLESNLHLDRKNPSLKTELSLFGIKLRFSASQAPLSPDGLQLQIRRASTIPFSIPSLIQNKTLPLDAAALLLLAVNSRFNITITGEPGSGKTTLLNALDMATPPIWRKIYIEDAIESRILGNHHQVRIKVDPVDERNGRFRKSDEIIKSLHRSPDYLILGEIQTAEHIQSLFQAMSAGLRTIQTCHSDSGAGLISRWTLVQGVELANIALMDVIVTMFRPVPGNSLRIVREIMEVRKGITDGGLEFRGLNRVYDCLDSDSKIGDWAMDGAFMFRSRELGVTTHETALYALIESLSGIIDHPDVESHSELHKMIWADGNPLKVE